jgi:hypothetical protein
MSIKVGTTEIATVGKIKLGTTNITKVFRGSVQIWPSFIFSATMTVGKNGGSTIYGYDSAAPYGSLTNTTMIINGLNTTFVALVYNINNSQLILYLNNGSNTSAPTQWDTITISGATYNRTNFTMTNLSGGSYSFLLNTTTNPLGATVGATREILLN